MLSSYFLFMNLHIKACFFLLVYVHQCNRMRQYGGEVASFYQLGVEMSVDCSISTEGPLADLDVQ